jgi:hypothetical protein
MRMSEVFVSTDVEADGPIPGPHSMLSFASAAFAEDGTALGTFERNLETLEGAAGHPKTMQWWRTQKRAWEACRRDTVAPEAAMEAYVTWLDALPGKPVFVAYPAGFDFLFVYWYLMRFAGKSPFSHSALDVKTYAAALLKCRFHDATKRNMPRRWFGENRHTHVALDDAREQGALFMNMRREHLQGREDDVTAARPIARSVPPQTTTPSQTEDP